MKKTKFMTKVMAVVFALAILFAMSVPAFAEGNAAGSNMPPIVTTFDTENDGTTVYTKIPLVKSLIFFNENTCNVYEPNITYEYSVAAAGTAPDTVTVTDSTSVLYKFVMDGVPAAINSTNGVAASVTYSSTNGVVQDVSSTGKEVTKTGYILFNPNAAGITKAGVYRYLITETTNAAAKNAVGIVQGGSYTNTRYMDVYIKNNAALTGFEVQAAVIFADSSFGADTNVTDTTVKTPGFNDNAQSASDYSGDTTADHYTTYNFSVKKVVDGALADKTNEFPFYVTVSNTINGAKYTYVDDPGTAAGSADTISGTGITKGSATGTGTGALTLKHNEMIKFIGVPSSTSDALSIAVQEWNNTPDKYTASVQDTNGNALNITGSSMAAISNGTMATAYTDAYDLKTNNVANQVITVTNAIEELSPTGLAFRVAPYVLMLAAGVSLIVLFVKRRREVTDMI